MKVDVYWNSNANVFSVRSREKESYGKIIAHMNSVFIENAKFVVQEAGRNRVIDSGVKNVHAFVRGHLIPEFRKSAQEGTLVSYNPFNDSRFTNGAGQGIDSASMVFCTTRAKKPVVAAVGITYHTNPADIV